MSFTTLTTVSDYEEKKRPAKSGKDRTKLTWQSILGYLPVYPWIHCEVSLDTFSGQFRGWKQPFDQLAIRSPFPTRRSTLRCPTECAASACGARCIGRRTAMPFPPICFSAKKPPYRTLMPTVFPNTCLHAELLRRTPLKCADSTKRGRRRALRAIFQGNLQKNLASCLHGRNN